MTVLAGCQQQRFSYRVASTRHDATKKRVLVVAAEDYTGTSPNKTPYATAPRYLAQHVDALKAAGYEVETFNTDAPPKASGSPSKYPRSSACSRTSTRSTTTRATTASRRTGASQLRATSTAATASPAAPGRAGARQGLVRAARLLNEGGKVVLDGRNVHQTRVDASTGLTRTRATSSTRTRLRLQLPGRTTAATTTARAPRTCAPHDVNNDIEQ